MEVTVPVRRAAPVLALRVTACAVALYVGVAPLGVPSLSAARGVAAVLAPADRQDAYLDVLGLALGRLALSLPLGDAGLRLAVLSSVCAAVALGFWASAAALVLRDLRPAAHARITAIDLAHEPVAVAGAATIVGLTPPFFAQAADASRGGLAFLLLAIWTWASLRVVHDRKDGHAAIGAAFVAGLTLADFPLVGALILPCGAGLWLWGLAHGARWAQLAPVAFSVGLALLVPAAALEAGYEATWAGWWDTLSLGPLWRSLTGASARTGMQAALALGESLGVVAGLLVVIGWGVLAWRAPAIAGVALFTLWAAVLLASAQRGATLVLGAWLGLAVVPLAVGLMHFSAKLGRARVPAALALVVMGAVAPAFSGGAARWLPDDRLPWRVLMRAQADVAPRQITPPAVEPLRTILDYGAAVGLRPDLARPSAEAPSARR